MSSRPSLSPLRLFSSVVVCLFLTAVAGAQSFHDESPENFRLEVTGSAWIFDSAGHLQSSGFPIDFVSDLNLSQAQPTFFGQLVYKPGRKHRIVVEGTPIQVNGFNRINRQISYQGEVFNISETVRSSADLNYLFAGYQYDLLSGPKGHLGLSAGGAYVSAYGSLLAVGDTSPSTGTQKIGLPLAGLDFRVFPIPRHRILEFDGGVRGMTLGGYGHFVEMTGNAGLCFGPVIFQAGYRAFNFDLHENQQNPDGIMARLQGPTFSVVFHW